MASEHVQVQAWLDTVMRAVKLCYHKTPTFKNLIKGKLFSNIVCILSNSNDKRYWRADSVSQPVGYKSSILINTSWSGTMSAFFRSQLLISAPFKALNIFDTSDSCFQLWPMCLWNSLTALFSNFCFNEPQQCLSTERDALWHESL